MTPQGPRTPRPCPCPSPSPRPRGPLRPHLLAAGPLLLAIIVTPGCDRAPARPHAPAAQPSPATASPAPSRAIEETRRIHGAPAHGVPGPWALAGHRVGQDALRRLGADRARPWELEVTHRSEPSPRYACVMDGVQAATGVSPGKLNLRHEAVTGEAATETRVLHRPTQRALIYRFTEGFRAFARDVPYDGFPAAAERLAAMKDEDVFTVSEEGKP